MAKRMLWLRMEVSTNTLLSESWIDWSQQTACLKTGYSRIERSGFEPSLGRISDLSSPASPPRRRWTLFLQYQTHWRSKRPKFKYVTKVSGISSIWNLGETSLSRTAWSHYQTTRTLLHNNLMLSMLKWPTSRVSASSESATDTSSPNIFPLLPFFYQAKSEH